MKFFEKDWIIVNSCSSDCKVYDYLMCWTHLGLDEFMQFVRMMAGSCLRVKNFMKFASVICKQAEEHLQVHMQMPRSDCPEAMGATVFAFLAATWNCLSKLLYFGS